VFAAFGSEIPTAGLIRRLRTGPPGHSRRLLLPFLRGQEMGAAEYLPEDELVPSAYGPMEPLRPVSVDPAEVDVAIAPGLAFDRSGHRLGYGGGHFDRFLGRMRPDAQRVGVCFAAQVLHEIPHGPNDQPVHVVVTDQETIFCR
jgi:5-formyltetrahydrofolate cyclo-ligase